MFACNGILFNHESPLRGETFVTRKITRAVAKIALGFQDKVFLGNLDAQRDWGHAKDYVECMWKILQQEQPEDWVIATGQTHSVRSFVQMSFKEIGVELKFQGLGRDEVGIVVACNNPDYQLEIDQEIVAIDPTYYRPTEVDLLIGDASKAKQKLGWEPKHTLEEICSEMVASDIELFKKERLLRNAGFKIKNEYE